MIDLRRR